MIYLDTSVALAHLLAEDRHPPDGFWSATLVSSRLLEYELWTRVHSLGHSKSHGDAVRTLLGRVAILELIPEILVRAREPARTPLRTLDALHLATARFLLEQGQAVRIATYDHRMSEAARGLGMELVPLP